MFKEYVDAESLTLHKPFYLPAGSGYRLLIENPLPSEWLWDFQPYLDFGLWTLPPSDTFRAAASAPLTLPFSSSVAIPQSGRLEAPFSTDSYVFSVGGSVAQKIDVHFSQVGTDPCANVVPSLVLPSGGRIDLASQCPSDLYLLLNPGTYTLIVRSDPTRELNTAQDTIVPKLYAMSVEQQRRAPRRSHSRRSTCSMEPSPTRPSGSPPP